MGWKSLPWIKKAIFGATFVYAAAFIVMLVIRPGTPEFYAGFFNVYQVLPPMFAAACSIYLALRGKHASKSTKAGWFLVGLGCFSFGMGQGTWTYYETIVGGSPFPGWADLGYLGVFPFLLTGILLLFRDVSTVGRTRILLDSAIAASSFGILSWYFIIEPIWADASASLLARLISVAYPMGDLALLFIAMVLFHSSATNRTMKRSLLWILAGTLMLAFADTVFTFLSMREAYSTGHWSDWGWSFGWLAIAFASLNKLWSNEDASESDESPDKTKPVSMMALFWPYIAVLGALVFLVLFDYEKNAELTPRFVLLFLVLIRQIAALLENHSLTRKLANINGELEDRVASRTRQLASLQQLTKAVNNTLVADKVLDEAATHCKEAFDADAVVIWLSEESLAGRRTLSVAVQQGLESRFDVAKTLLGQPIRDRAETVQFFCGPAQDKEAVTCLLAPLSFQRRQLGMIGALRWSGNFAAKDLELIESIGLEVGMALENAREHTKALQAADRDSVTDLLNHRAFHGRFTAAVANSERTNRPLSVLMMDLDDFKLFNDTYGHIKGDQVLKSVSLTLTSECPTNAIAARYGGDEFIVVIPGDDGSQASEFAVKMRQEMARLGFSREDSENTVPIGVSCGIATYPEDGIKPNEIIACADWNMYRAKGNKEGIARTTSLHHHQKSLQTEDSFQILDAMVIAVDNKDRYTRKHSEDVTEYAIWIAEELGHSEEAIKTLRLAGLLHDVGKIGVPDDILRKPGKLTAEEYEIMQRHPALGSMIASAIPGMAPIVDGIRSHHERWDGNGYPDQLAGEDIPLLGRILAVPDAFSAMTTDRPYRKGMSWEEALEEIRKNVGTQFDPTIARAFLKVAQARLADGGLDRGAAA